MASVHHRGTQCFVCHGNLKHEVAGGEEVSLIEFQAAVKSRHRVGSSGILDLEREGANGATADFA